MPFNLDVLVSSGVIVSLLTGLYATAHILLNKRIKTPADQEASRRADIVERNEILETYKTDLKDAKVDIESLKTHVNGLDDKIDEQDTEMTGLRKEIRMRDDYIWKCIRVIKELGTSDDIPQPYPDGYVP